MKNKQKIWYRRGFEPRVTDVANRNATVKPQRHSVSVLCCTHLVGSEEMLWARQKRLGEYFQQPQLFQTVVVVVQCLPP